MNLNRDMLQKVLHSELVEGSPEQLKDMTGISIDSRTVRRGELFFAIVGDKHDGHSFVRDAIGKGAMAAVINYGRMNEFADLAEGVVYAVDDTHEALLNLAAYIRRCTDASFAAVTGSNGKTTTKEMLYSICNIAHNAYRSPGNLNNLYGLPLSLGQMPRDTEYAVFELGISVPGEMTRLASVIKPELALITNIAATHLETLGSVENVVKAKFELVDNLPVGAVIVLNNDDAHITAEAMRRGLDYVSYGIDNDSDFTARKIKEHDNGTQIFVVKDTEITLPLCGRVNIYNALAAIAASSVWECEPEEWQQGLHAFKPVEMRMIIEKFQDMRLIIDCYNSNPGSLKAALQCLKGFTASGKKYAVLGDMLELGENSPQFHLDAGRDAAASGIAALFCLGPLSKKMVEGARAAGMKGDAVRHFEKHEEVLSALIETIGAGDLILFKGSRGMQLEKIVNGLKEMKR